MTTAGNHRDVENPEQDSAAPMDGTEVDADSIPVHGNEAEADEMAEEAYGDQDDDGNPDIPNVPFPG